MKTKIALAVALVALFVVVPSATPKGHPPAAVPGATVSCTENEGAGTPANPDNDTCTISFTGLNPGTTYDITITDSCGGGTATQRSGSSAYSFILDLNDCGTGLTITVTSGTGRKTTTVLIMVTGDTGPV